MSGDIDPDYDDFSPTWLLFYLGLGGGTVATLLWGPGSGAGAVMLWVPMVCVGFVLAVRAGRWTSVQWSHLVARLRFYRAPY